VYEYEKAKRENWESFGADLQQTIEKNPSIKCLKEREAYHDSKQLINKQKCKEGMITVAPRSSRNQQTSKGTEEA
ncbi:4918_t:CDS:2, partial [Gigaspora rosea]